MRYYIRMIRTTVNPPLRSPAQECVFQKREARTQPEFVFIHNDLKRAHTEVRPPDSVAPQIRMTSIFIRDKHINLQIAFVPIIGSFVTVSVAR